MDVEFSEFPRSQPALKTFCRSLVVGFGFLLLTIACLWGIVVFNWLQNGYWATSGLYDQGGYPCLGVFAITSAAYFVSKQIRCRFVSALIVLACATFLIYFSAHIAGFLPQKPKDIEAHWLRPKILFWLLMPPWLVAVGIVFLRRNLQQNHAIGSE